MAKPKVLFFMSSASGVGGVETWLAAIVAALPEAGFEPVIALTRGLKSNDPDRFRKLNPELPCVEVDGSALPAPSRILACERLIRRINPSIVIPLGVIDAVPASGIARHRGQDIRVVCRTQGLLAPMLADLEDLNGIFDFAVCDGRLNAIYLERMIGFPAQSIRHVPNGADNPIRDRVPKEPDQPLRIVYLGRLTAGDKRATDLGPVVRQLDALDVDYRLRIVGDGPSRSVLDKELGGHNRVTFTGSLPHDRVYEEVLPFSDVLLSLSSSESFGISIVEAMMHGVVPVSSRFLGHRTVGTVENEVNALLFDIGDVRQAASQVQRLAVDSNLLEDLSKRAASKAKAEFSWERCTTAWLDVLTMVEALPSRNIEFDASSYLRGNAGKLDRLGMPVRAVDMLRRIRSRVVPAVEPGGEEWPLYYRHHSKARLDRISEKCATLENESVTSPKPVVVSDTSRDSSISAG